MRHGLMGVWVVAGTALAAPFAPPRLRVEPPGRVDLGELGPLEARYQSYTFSNTSGAPIALRLLDLAPGVSVAGPALERPIPARGSARLVLRMDPAGLGGPQSRNVRLGTDDPRQGSYYLPVRMTVRPDLTVDGTRRDYGDVGLRESPSAVFSFARETGQPLALRLATALPPYLECDLQAAGPGARLAFILRPGRVPPGMLLGLDRVRVESNAPLQPGFDLYLEWRLRRAIQASPPRLLFRQSGPERLELKLRSRSGSPFRILGAELEGAGFQPGQLPAAPAAEQALVIRRTAPAGARAMLVLRFEGEDEPLRVPLTCLADPGALDEGVMVMDNKPD